MQGGLFGVVVCVLILAWPFIATLFQLPGLRRALAPFILTYCLLTSFTEDAFTDASTYLLGLVVAASLLVIPVLGHYEQGSPDLDEADIRPGV